MTPRSGLQMMCLLGTAAMACCLGCSAESTTPGPATEPAATSGIAENQSNALFTVEIEPGHSVAFYEPAPGVVFPFERMKPGQHSRLAGYEGSDLLDLYAKLRPGEAVPDVLAEANARSEVATVEDPPDAEPRPAFGGGSKAPQTADIPSTDPGVGVIRQASSSTDPAHFVNDHDGCLAGDIFAHCRVSWYNGYWASANAKSQHCVVDHFSGNGVVVRFQAGTAISDNYLAPGTLGYYLNYLPKVTQLRRIDVIDAENDGFHVGCYWGNHY